MMMTRTLWKSGPWALLATLLFTLPAAANTRECKRQCEKDTKQCEAICKKHAGSGVDKCTNACQEEEKLCSKECDPNAKVSK